jgi:hypothetical protein
MDRKRSEQIKRSGRSTTASEAQNPFLGSLVGSPLLPKLCKPTLPVLMFLPCFSLFLRCSFKIFLVLIPLFLFHPKLSICLKSPSVATLLEVLLPRALFLFSFLGSVFFPQFCVLVASGGCEDQTAVSNGESHKRGGSRFNTASTLTVP